MYFSSSKRFFGFFFVANQSKSSMTFGQRKFKIKHVLAKVDKLHFVVLRKSHLKFLKFPLAWLSSATY